MRNTFITKIHIGKVRHLENVDIVLSENERKHLILTGKNGCGKTSVLEEFRTLVWARQNRNKSYSYNEANLGITLSDGISNLFDIIFAYISMGRGNMVVPNVVARVDNGNKMDITRSASSDFLNYILHLYVKYLSAKDTDSNSEEVKQYISWFDRFTQALRDIYDCQELELKPDMKNFTFRIILPGRESFNLNEMSDGYKAFLEIYMELIMRFESADAVVEYNQPAIVLIDEVETHLHVELQRRALPFLTKMFPNVQFIVTTHSPFVITSLANAVVFDLEKLIRLDVDDLTEYSYTDIVEGYYGVSECSASLKTDFDRYVELCSRDSRTAAEREETRKLFERLSKIPGTSPLSMAFYLFERRTRNGKD